MTCKSNVGKTWGISPSKLRWIYNQVILPTLGCACVLLIHRINNTNYLLKMLEKVQKLATSQITGGFVSTLSITLDNTAGIMPIEINLNEQASKTAIRLKLNDGWFQDTNFGCKKSYIFHARHLDKKLLALKSYYDNPRGLS